MDPLLQPFKIKHLTLRNRVLSTAHAPSYQVDGHPKDRYRLYHEEKARGGVGLTMIGGSTNISPDSPSVFGQLYAGDDSIIPWFKKLTTGVKQHGAAIMCQITHMGRRTAWDDGHWLPVLAPSGSRERAHRSFPKCMEPEDFDRVITDFALAAKRCQEGGFDGIELLSHAHLLGQFLSPLINHRSDEYGGSLENRLRLTFQVIDAVRDMVGPEFIVGIRVTGDESLEGGIDADEGVKIAKFLSTTGAIDFLNVMGGAPYDDLGLSSWVPPMGIPSAPHLSVAARIRESVEIPVFHAGGMADVATARHAIADRLVDLVGMTRAQIADPHLVSKLMNGNEDRIRPCVGLGYCVDRVNQGKPMVCGHNAATGREATQPHLITSSTTKKRVVVVGGGAAGMEAARLTALRGHDVILYEASDRLGGQLNLAAKSTTRRSVSGVSDWLQNEIEQLKVTVRLNHYVEADEILDNNPDLVFIATGGWPKLPDIPGQQYLTSSWDILTGEVRASGEVLLLDETGDQAASVCADVMAQAGCKVLMVTPDRAIAHDLGPTNSSVVLRNLSIQNVEFRCFNELISAQKTGNRKNAALSNVLTGNRTTETVDFIVVENGVQPSDEIYHQLKPYSCNNGQANQSALVSGKDPFLKIAKDKGFILARIGDSIAGRNIHAALYDALRIARHC